MNQSDSGSEQPAAGAPAAGVASVPAPASRLPAATGTAAPGRHGAAARPWVRELLVLAGFLAAGVAATWPRAAYLTGTLPRGSDPASYVWSLWWVARQLTHLANPWATHYLAAPAGLPLGYDTLMPLLGLVMAPVTLFFGPSASFTLLAIVTPGLAGYAMYRAARLWLPTRTGAIAAGALFGLSGMLDWQDWYHLNIAIGTVFLPLALETAIRLRRDPSLRRGLVLGVVIGASVLVNQESAVMAAIIAALALAPWLLSVPNRARVSALAAGAAVAAVIAAPQVLTMAAQAGAGQAATSALSGQYERLAGELPSLFAPSTRVAEYGLGSLASIYTAHTRGEALATFGVVLTLLALLGLAVSWRRRGTVRLGLLWLASALLALGPTLYLAGHRYVPLPQLWQGGHVSLLMPYTWFVRLPGLSAFREADRLAFLGLVAAALLAGAAVEWLRGHARLVLAVAVVLGVLEAGWAGNSPQPTMPTTMTAGDVAGARHRRRPPAGRFLHVLAAPADGRGRPAACLPHPAGGRPAGSPQHAGAARRRPGRCGPARHPLADPLAAAAVGLADPLPRRHRVPLPAPGRRRQPVPALRVPWASAARKRAGTRPATPG